MARKEILFKHKERRDLAGVAELLRAMADKLEEGELTLVQGEQASTLELPDVVRLTMKGKKKVKKHKTKHTVKLQLKWDDRATSQARLQLK